MDFYLAEDHRIEDHSLPINTLEAGTGLVERRRALDSGRLLVIEKGGVEVRCTMFAPVESKM